MTSQSVAQKINMQVGLIGVGTMGRLMLKQLVKAGFHTYVFDLDPRACEFADGIGAKLLSTPQAIAKSSDVILLCLPGPIQIEDVVLGPEGLLTATREGQVVIDLSTVGPDTTKRMAKRISEAGGDYLDAPILGRPAAVGRWMLPVGGDEDVLEKCKPVLETFAERAVLVGPSGAGNTLKLLNQLMFSTINCITAEVFAICDKTGLSKSVFFETIAASSAATVSGLFRESGKKIVGREFEPTFSIDLLCKDTQLGLSMAKAVGAPSVIADIVQTYNEIAMTTGLGMQDTSAIVKIFEDLYQRRHPEDQNQQGVQI